MKIYTWNTQGQRWDAIKQRINAHAPDILCIQEAGNLPDKLGYGGACEFQDPTNIGTYNDYNVWFLTWDRNDGNGNIRCSMAMIYKDSGKPAVSWSRDTYKRPIMRKLVGNYYIGNIHAGGQQYVNEAVQSVKTNAGSHPWCIAGDFNQDAKGNLSWMDRQGGNVVKPSEDTRPQSHKILDYGVCKTAATATTPDPNYGGSDHRGVLIEC